MTKIWTENEVTVEALAEHMRNSGLTSVNQETNRIVLHTESGIGYAVLIDAQRKFIEFTTHLPLDKAKPRQQILDFEHRCNAEIYLPVFCVDEDADLRIFYAMPYSHGLIAGQLMAMVCRFGSLLEHVVGARNEDGLILLGRQRKVPDEIAAALDTQPPESGTLLN
jgi:hypothetical protein